MNSINVCRRAPPGLQTSAVFSETRYATNGDLGVVYTVRREKVLHIDQHIDRPEGSTMTGEQQKQRAKELLQAAERGDVAAVEAMISDDFTLEEMLRVPIMLPTGEPLATVYDKEAYLDFVRSIPSFTRDGMHFTYELAMSEGPYVVLFGESNATALSGKKYANAYTWLFRFADDKIALLREYCDTHLVRTVLFG